MPYVPASRRSPDDRAKALAHSPLGRGFVDDNLTETQRWLAEELAFVWLDFEQRLSGLPIIACIEDGTVTVEDYRRLLVNLRQQVIEGGRWLALWGSSMSIELFEVRSLLIRHAAEEHRDYQMLEQNFVSVGGTPTELLSQPKNVGSEALSSYIFHQAAQPDPLHLFGAMFIIEGLGTAKAAGWAKQLRQTLGLDEDQVSFLAYHGANDDDHYDKLRRMLTHPRIDRPIAERIAKTAKVVGRLYALQLEELDNI